jgi:microcystin-dependent protein
MDIDTLPPGAIIFTAGQPAGALPCLGQAVRKAEYPELYEALGDVYGGANDEAFRLPDFGAGFFCKF